MCTLNYSVIFQTQCIMLLWLVDSRVMWACIS